MAKDFLTQTKEQTMKKLSALILAISLFSFSAHAQTVPVCTVGPCSTPAFLPYALGAVAFGEFVIYADANGIPFPLCGMNGWQCFYEYPSDRK
jgi:hypothetical protein